MVVVVVVVAFPLFRSSGLKIEDGDGCRFNYSTEIASSSGMYWSLQRGCDLSGAFLSFTSDIVSASPLMFSIFIFSGIVNDVRKKVCV